MKVLNLYAGIGGNRKLWENVEVTAVEINPQITKVYQELYPNDKVIIADAHEYLLKHFKEYDFIWSSPPCPSHSCIRKIGCNPRKDGIEPHKPIYPDMALYQEIILLEGYFHGKYCIENVMPYYEPLIKANKIHRHLFWSNYPMPKENFDLTRKHDMNMEEWKNQLGVDLTKFDIDPSLYRAIHRNCVDSELGLYAFNCAYNKKQEVLFDFN